MSYTNQGTIIHLDAKGDFHIDNYGTIMHVESNAYNVTIINHGEIMHAGHCSVINAKQRKLNGGIVRVESRARDLKAIQELKKTILQKDASISRLKLQIEHLENRQPEQIERAWGYKRIKQLEEINARHTIRVKRLTKDLKDRDATIKQLNFEIAKPGNRKLIRDLESTVESLRDTVGFQNHELNGMRSEIADLQEQLAQTDRPQLIETIDDLRQRLRRSQNREITSRDQSFQDGYRRGVIDGSNKKREATDWPCRPTKEQAEAVMKQLRIWLDCET